MWMAVVVLILIMIGGGGREGDDDDCFSDLWNKATRCWNREVTRCKSTQRNRKPECCR